MTHFKNIHTRITTYEYAERGVTVRPGKSWGVELLLHNGCGSGNMTATLAPEVAIDIAAELIRQAREAQKAKVEKDRAAHQRARAPLAPAKPASLPTVQ